MRVPNNPDSAPFAKAKKKGKKNPDFRSMNFANNRRNVRRLPTRQFSRGR